MFTAIQYVTSGLTLIAFVVAVAAYMYRAKLRSMENRIKSAPESNRAALVDKTLEFFSVDASQLTKSQQYDIALRQITARADRFRIAAFLVFALAVVLASVAAYSYSITPGPTKEQKSFVTKLWVWADFDADIYVDGEKKMKINHRSGFSYASTKVRISPSSVMTIKANSFEKKVSLWSLCKANADECQVHIGTDTNSDVQISEDEKRAAIGSDVPRLTRELTSGKKSSARAWAAGQLGYIGGQDAIKALLKALRDRDPWVQAVAAESLGRIGDPTVLPELESAYARYAAKERWGYKFEAAIRELKSAPNRGKE